MERWRRIRGWLALTVGYLLLYLVTFAEAAYSLPRNLNRDCLGMLLEMIQHINEWEGARAFAMGPCQHLTRLSLWLFLGAILLLAFGYLDLIRAIGRQPAAWTLPRILRAALLATLPLLLLIPPTSADSLSYLWAGRVVSVYHLSPWHHPLAEFRAEQNYISPLLWGSNLRCVYGPVWVAVMTATTSVSHLLLPGAMTPTALMLNVVLLRLANAAALVAAIGAVWKIQGLLAPRQQRLITALFALNPLLIYETLGALHNDIWGVALLLWSCYLFLLGNPRFVLPLALSILTKPVALAVVPLLAVALARRRNWAQMASLAAVLLLWIGVNRLTGDDYLGARLAGSATSFGVSPTSMPQFLACLALLAHPITFATAVSVVARALTLLFLPLFALLAWRTRSREQAIQHGTWVLLLYLTGVYMQTMQWYYLWPLALLFAMPWSRATANAAWGATSLLLGYLSYFLYHNVNYAAPGMVTGFLLAIVLPGAIWMAGQRGWWLACPHTEQTITNEKPRHKPGRRGSRLLDATSMPEHELAGANRSK